MITKVKITREEYEKAQNIVWDYEEQIKDDKKIDVFADLRKIGLTSDACCLVDDYIKKHFEFKDGYYE